MWWVRLCVEYNLDFNTVDIWRAICESMPEDGICWRDGCENSLKGYRSHAIWCCPNCQATVWAKENPDRKMANDRVRKQTPKYRAYRRANYARKKAELSLKL